jgi:FtsZ-interacting cell division protein ZipA
MSDLRLGLLLVGVLVVAAVVLYNKWLERQYRRRSEASFSARHEDVLMRQGAPGQAEVRQTPLEPERVEPVLGSLDGPQSEQGLSEILDFIVPIETPDEISGAAVLSAADVALRRRHRGVRWEGFDTRRGVWEPLDSERHYSRLRAGMQLVDRRGAVDSEELGEFALAIEDTVASLGLLATAPDPAPALARAKELDRFCGEVDIRVAVHIVSDTTPFAGARLAELAKNAGFEFDGADGKFRRRDQEGRVLCALMNSGPNPFSDARLDSLPMQSVTLELDVPRSPPGAYELFSGWARMFAQGLNARVVDDNRASLGASAFEAIGAQILAVHRRMGARGMAPGGALALRLFS